MKRIAWYAFVVLATITLLLVLWQLRTVVILFLLAIATAAAFRPLIAILETRKIPRGLALIIAYGSVLGVIAILVALMSRPLLEDLQLASNQLATAYDIIITTWPAGSSAQQWIATQLPSMNQAAARWTGVESRESVQTLLGMTGSLFGFVGNLVLILILSIYWSADFLRFERLWLTLLPAEARPQARDTYRAIETSLGAYIRSEVVQSMLAGIMLWIGFEVLGLQFAVLLALFGALAWLVPWFGAIVAIIPPLVVAVGQGGLPLAGLVLAYTILVFFIQEWVIEPKFFKRETYSSVILVMMILILAREFGLLGLVIAPLASAAIQITLRNLAQPPAVANLARIEVSEARLEINNLQEKVEAVQIQMKEDAVDDAPELLNLTERLKKLISDTQAYLAEHSDEVQAQAEPDRRERMPLPGQINSNR